MFTPFFEKAHIGTATITNLKLGFMQEMTLEVAFTLVLLSLLTNAFACNSDEIKRVGKYKQSMFYIRI